MTKKLNSYLIQSIEAYLCGNIMKEIGKYKKKTKVKNDCHLE